MTEPVLPRDPDPTDRRPAHEVLYKGAPLDSAKGPGLGCFWIQVVVLAVVVVLTPLSAAWNWPLPISIVLLATTLVLLLFVGQTAIFLMRLVAADRRADGRRRPLASPTRTVGELEDADLATGTGADVATGSAEERRVLADEPADDGVRE